MDFLALAAAVLLTPAVKNMEVPPVGPGAVLEEPVPPVGDEYNPVAHMVITRLAYRKYVSEYQGGELERYIGDLAGDTPPAGHNTVVAGAYEEDKSYKNPFN